ncbi:hypothetical protein DRQ36_01705 [bacterium]|nr:MAG: hypothetical protein DRQ36_01705 [bacterium]
MRRMLLFATFFLVWLTSVYATVGISTDFSGFDEWPHYRIIGLSEDGRYLAWGQWHSGYDNYRYDVYFIDVPNNEWKFSPVSAEGLADDGKCIALFNSKDKIERLGINYLCTPGLYQYYNSQQNPSSCFGTGIVRESQDGIEHLSCDDTTLTHSLFISDIKWDEDGRKYRLVLQEYNARFDTCPSGTISERKMISLFLVNEANRDTLILQRDKFLPESRGPIMDYWIEDVYLYPCLTPWDGRETNLTDIESIIVFLGMYVRRGVSFDPDEFFRFMCVTGRVKEFFNK